MDNRFLGDVLNEMQPFFDEQGFEAQEDGIFKSKTKAVKVEYSEERQMFLLLKADITEDGEGELSEINVGFLMTVRTPRTHRQLVSTLPRHSARI